MGESEGREGQAASALAIILLQLAASEAEIGSFARRQRSSPREAALRYREAAAMQTLYRRGQRA